MVLKLKVDTCLGRTDLCVQDAAHDEDARTSVPSGTVHPDLPCFMLTFIKEYPVINVQNFTEFYI
jgi:hypothetical protein